jgi:hypothetical protein
LEAGQAVLAHGVDRGLDADEVLRSGGGERDLTGASASH